MTVTDLHGREDTANLAERADELHARLMDRLHQDVRAALNESQIIAKGRALDDALDIFDAAQRERRTVEDAAGLAKDALDQAVVRAKWDAASKVVQEGNKFFVPDGEERQQVTAAIRDEWIDAQAAQNPAVVKARSELRKAEQRVAEAKDTLERARLTIGIRRTQAELAGIHVQAIAGTLRGER